MGRSAGGIGLVAALFLGLGTVDLAAEPEADGVERYELENGLKVRLLPIANAKSVAVLVLYDVGEAHDPEGKSGLAHLTEHCYVTCAAGETPARTARAMMAAYPSAWNAQTGSDYTVIAFVAPAAGLERELKDAAARMGDLKITEADLEREKPRMVEELRNMYGRVPVLAAVNHGRAAVFPAAPGARKGGVVEQIQAMTVEDVRGHHEAYYRPRNARLVLVGAFDSAAARTHVAKAFGSIPGGEPLPAPRAPAAASSDRRARIALEDAFPGTSSQVCLARRAPTPDAATYAPFLILIRRLFQAQDPSAAAAPKVVYSLLDAPEVLFLTASVGEGGEPDAVAAKLQKHLDAIGEKALTPVERFQTAQMFAYQLGTFPIPLHMRGNNPYGTAFAVMTLQRCLP